MGTACTSSPVTAKEENVDSGSPVAGRPFPTARRLTLGAFPYLYDVSGDGLDGLSVLLADDEKGSEQCHLYLWARDVAEVGGEDE